MGETIFIYKNKKKQLIAVVLLSFLALIAYLVLNYLFHLLRGLSDFKIEIVLILAGLFCFAFFLLIRQISRNSPALIIDEAGITDHSSMSGVGFIPESEIISVYIKQNFFQKLIIVKIKNPERYIDNLKSGLKQKVAINYLQTFGTPVVINALGLNCNFIQLTQILKSRYTFETNS